MIGVISLLTFAATSAALLAASHSWRDAEVISISESDVVSESVGYSKSSNGDYPAVPTHVVTDRTKIWTYTLSASGSHYIGRTQGRAIKGLIKGGRVQLDVTKKALYVLTNDRKEHRLRALTSE